MEDSFDKAARRCRPHLETAFQRSVEHGIDPDKVALVMLQFSCGALKGVLPPVLARSHILKVRDDLWAELTLMADRCR